MSFRNAILVIGVAFADELCQEQTNLMQKPSTLQKRQLALNEEGCISGKCHPTTPPPEITEPPRVCEPGEEDNGNPCNPKTCAEDGMSWHEVVVDCPQGMGVPCPGNWVEPAPGECCSTCEPTPPPQICKPGSKDNTNPCNPKTCARDGMKWHEVHVDCPQAMGAPCLGNWVKPAPGKCCSTCEATPPPQICKPGSKDDSNPCNPKTCARDGMKWHEVHVDCPQDMGVPCFGDWVKPAPGKCCSTCVATTTTTTSEEIVVTTTKAPTRPVTPPPQATDCSSFVGVSDSSLMEDCTNKDMFEFKLAVNAKFVKPTFKPHEYGSDDAWKVWPIQESKTWRGTEKQNCVAYVSTGGKTCEWWCKKRGMKCVAGMDDAHFQTDNLYQWLKTEGYPKSRCTILPAGHKRKSTANNGCNQGWSTQMCSCTASKLKKKR